MPRLLRIALVLLFFAPLAHGQSTEAGLRVRLLEKQFLLRGCWEGTNLWFSFDGRPLNSYPELPFTLSGVRIERIKLTHNALELEGHRMGLEIDKNKGSMHWVPVVTADTPKEKAIENIQLHIAVPPTGDYGPTLDAILVDGVADLAPHLPEYWQLTAQHFWGLTTPSADRLHGPDLANSGTMGTFSGGPAASANGKMTQPTLVSGANPDYTPAARRLKYKTAVILNFVVEADGSVSHPQIIAPAGLGLDEAAIAAVLKYKFKPGTKDGKPERMQIGSSVSFDIF